MQALHEMMTFLVSMENRISSLQAFFFFNDTATTEIYTLSLHDALPICRCLREFRTPFALAGSRVRLAHGAVRAADPQTATRHLAGALPMDRPGGTEVLPEPPRPGAARRRVRPGRDARPVSHARRAGARARGAAVQARRSVADERCHGAGLRSDAMSDIPGSAKPAIAHGMRLQWEPAQEPHLLLDPEGMVRRNSNAGAILSRCDGVRTLTDIVTDLERTYSVAGLGDDVTAFVALALDKHWLELRE